MPFSVLNFGSYLLPVEEGEAEVELDGYDGFFDQAFSGMKVGNPIEFIVSAFSEASHEKLWREERDAPFVMDAKVAERAFGEAMRFRYLWTEITEYGSDSGVRVKVKDACALGDFVAGTRRMSLDIERLRARTKEHVEMYRRGIARESGFWPQESCPLPSIEMLRQAERHEVHGVGLAERMRRKHLLVKHGGSGRTGSESGRSGFFALFLGTNDRDSSFLIEIPSIEEYEELLGGYATAAESEEELRIWKFRLSLRALA